MTLNKLKLLTVLLYLPGKSRKYNEKIKGITRINKILFLIQKNLKMNFYDFEPYFYGPWSPEIHNDIKLLNEGGILQIDNEEITFSAEISDLNLDDDEIVNFVEIYSLTNNGINAAKKICEDMNKDISNIIFEIKSSFNYLALTDLLKFVYNKYPEMIIKSKILKSITNANLYGKRPELKEIEEDED